MLLALVGVLLLAPGCESISYTGSGPFRSVQPQLRTFSADKRTVFHAVQKALKGMDYTLTKMQLSRGQVVGISNLRDTVVFGAARQFEFNIKLVEVGGGQTEVEVRLFEQSEADFKGSATNRAVAEHGLYDSLFESLSALLKKQAMPYGADAP